jgi:6-phosphofructokinase 1
LIARKINRLVIIGGDGSLTGASILAKEWPDLLKEIQEEEQLQIDEEHKFLVVIGLVGSIDNDMCGTDQTIGADTALNHIIRAVDSVLSTAASHQREFVVEVMGRNCGWLGLMGAIASAADWLVIPERPLAGNWKANMCDTIKKVYLIFVSLKRF